MGKYLIVGGGSGIGKEIKDILRSQNESVLVASRENRSNESDFFTLDVTRTESFPELDLDLKGLAYWLLSDKSQFVTGQIWKVDGGLGSLKVGS